MILRCFVIFIAVLLLVDAMKLKNPAEKDDPATFLMSHMSEYETIEEFQKFLETAPPVLHPSLTQMWILQRQIQSAPREITTTPETDISTSASTISTTMKVNELPKKQEKTKCDAEVEVTEDYDTAT